MVRMRSGRRTLGSPQLFDEGNTNPNPSHDEMMWSHNKVTGDVRTINLVHSRDNSENEADRVLRNESYKEQKHEQDLSD